MTENWKARSGRRVLKDNLHWAMCHIGTFVCVNVWKQIEIESVQFGRHIEKCIEVRIRQCSSNHDISH